MVVLTPAAEDRIASRHDEIIHALVVRDAVLDGSGRDANGGAQIAHIRFAQALTHEESHASGREFFGGGHAHQGGLARAIGADDDPTLIELHLPVDGPDQRAPAAS